MTENKVINEHVHLTQTRSFRANMILISGSLTGIRDINEFFI